MRPRAPVVRARVTANRDFVALWVGQTISEMGSRITREGLPLSSSLAEIVGPGLTGVLVQLITAPLAILFDALSFLISALSVAAIRRPEPAPAPRQAEGLWVETLAGLRFIFAEPLLRALGLRSATAFLCHGFMGSLYMLYAIDVLHIRPALLGAVIALGGVGAMAGALAAQPVARRLGLGTTFIATSALYGLLSLLIPTAGAVPAYAALVLMVPQLIGDAMYSMYSIHEVSLRQSVAPEAVLGRVNAGMRMLQLGILPIGALCGGLLAARLGVRPTLALAAAGLLLSTLWLAASPIRRLR